MFDYWQTLVSLLKIILPTQGRVQDLAMYNLGVSRLVGKREHGKWVRVLVPKRKVPKAVD